MREINTTHLENQLKMSKYRGGSVAKFIPFECVRHPARHKQVHDARARCFRWKAITGGD